MYVWDGFRVVEVVPSPKFHSLLVILPVEALVNCTTRGLLPLLGAAVKSATGPGSVNCTKSPIITVSEPPGPETVKPTV